MGVDKKIHFDKYTQRKKLFYYFIKLFIYFITLMELALIILINLLKNNIIKKNKTKIINKNVFSGLDSFCKFSTLNENNHKSILIEIKNTKRNNLLFFKKMIKLFELIYKSIIYVIYEIMIHKIIYEFIIQRIKYIVLYIIDNDISFSIFFFNFINNNKKITNFLLKIKNFTSFYNENDEYFKLKFNR